MGDFNLKVGKDKMEDIGEFRLGVTILLIQFCHELDMVVTNQYY